MEKDVSIRLGEAGCKLKDGDCDFSIQDLFRYAVSNVVFLDCVSLFMQSLIVLPVVI